MGYSPWEHLSSLPHITFGITRLPVGKGWWMPDMQAIAIDARLTQVERRVVLAHELVHAERHDSSCHHEGPDGPRQARRQEARADATAAERLIGLGDLIAALAAHPYDPDMVADELNVTTAMLKVRLQKLSDEDKLLMERRLIEIGAIHDY